MNTVLSSLNSLFPNSSLNVPSEYASVATKEKVFVGIGNNYFSNKGIGEFIIQAQELKKGDDILITGPTTGVIESVAEDIWIDKPVDVAKKGDIITIAIPEKIRKNDKLFVIKNKNVY